MDPWSLRASDADRAKYLDVLGEAFAEGRLSAEEYDERIEAVYQARTYRDLVPVLEALPVKPGSVPGPPTLHSQPAGRSTNPNPTTGSVGVPAGQAQAGPPPTASGRLVPVPPAAIANASPATSQGSGAITAIFSSQNREGQWLMPPLQSASAVMGEVILDLTSAVLPSYEVEIRAFALMGSVIVKVPDSVRVEVSGTPFMGEFVTKDKRKGADRQRVPSDPSPVVRVSGAAIMGSVEVRIVKPKPHQLALSILQQTAPGPPPFGGPQPAVDQAPRKPELSPPTTKPSGEQGPSPEEGSGPAREPGLAPNPEASEDGRRDTGD